MQTGKAFLLIGIVVVILFSSCKNKELEQANKELEKSSETIREVNDFILSRMYKDGLERENAKYLYDKAKSIDSVIESVINKDTNSANYIIQYYDSLLLFFQNIRYVPSDFRSMDKRTNYATAKNKLIRLEKECIAELYKNINVSNCCFCPPFGDLDATVLTIGDSSFISIYTDFQKEIIIKPNTISLWLVNGKEKNHSKRLTQEVMYQVRPPFVIMRTTKLPKGLIGVCAKLEILPPEFDDFLAEGYNE